MTDIVTALHAIADAHPGRMIVGRDGSTYLERYTLADLPDGGHVFLHRFLRSDEDRELHNHPWPGESRILLGSYREERRIDDRVVARIYRAGNTNTLAPDTFHRIELLSSEVWTLFTTGPRVQSWGFWDRETKAFTPWREFIRNKGLVPYEHPKGAA